MNFDIFEFLPDILSIAIAMKCYTKGFKNSLESSILYSVASIYERNSAESYLICSPRLPV